jgi:four helix bundle protein
MNSRASELDQRLVEYADQICKLAERLPGTRAGNHAAGQLLRSGMSPLPVLGASEAAGSKDELISDLRACLRSLEEGRRWLRFIRHVPLIQPVGQTDPLFSETESLIRIFAARLWTERSKSALRWRLRQPRPIRRRRNNVWTLAKAAYRRVWRG